MTSLQQARTVDDLLLEAIDETMVNLFSREVDEALYLHLQRFYSVGRHEVPKKLETLCVVLEKTFGGPNSKTISRAIAKRFYAKLELHFPKHVSSSLTLSAYVEDAKLTLRNRNRRPGVQEKKAR